MAAAAQNLQQKPTDNLASALRTSGTPAAPAGLLTVTAMWRGSILRTAQLMTTKWQLTAAAVI